MALVNVPDYHKYDTEAMLEIIKQTAPKHNPSELAYRFQHTIIGHTVKTMRARTHSEVSRERW
jgi:hypothetical protein